MDRLNKTLSGICYIPFSQSELIRSWRDMINLNILKGDTEILQQNLFKMVVIQVNHKQAGGGGIRPQAGSSLCCAETVSNKKLKLCDFCYIPIGFHSEYKTVP